MTFMDSTDIDILDQLARRIAAHSTPKVPLEKTLWSSDECADYLRMAKATFQNTYAPHPKFPRPIRLDVGERRSRPIWLAIDVINWAINQRPATRR